MPLYFITTQKNFGPTYWTNVYEISAANINEAGTRGLQIADLEAEVYPPGININAVRASTTAKRDGVFIVFPTNIEGKRVQAGEYLPLWNRFLVRFSVGPTYQLRKFFFGMKETDQQDGEVSQATLTTIQNNFIEPVLELGYICNKNLLPAIEGTVAQQVAMRQLRRRKKRTTPVIVP